MKLDDEKLSAWLHGALPPEEAIRIAEAVSEDEGLAERIDAMNRIDVLVRKAVPLDETIPAELMERLGFSCEGETGKVVDLADRRETPASAIDLANDNSSGLLSGTWRIAAQVLLVACLGLGSMMWHSSGNDRPDATYRTLSASSLPHAATSKVVNALVIFDNGVTQDEAHAIIRAAGGQIVGKPTTAGAWTVSIEPRRQAKVIEALRAMPDVMLAEPVEGGRR